MAGRPSVVIGIVLLAVGTAALALGLFFAVLPGESEMKLLPLVALFPIYTPAIIAGLILLFVGLVRERRAAAGTGLPVRSAAASPAAGQEGASGTSQSTRTPFYVGAGVLLVYGWLGASSSVLMGLGGWLSPLHHAEPWITRNLLWHLCIAGAGVYLLVYARRH